MNAGARRRPPTLPPGLGRAAAELLLRRRVRGSLAEWARYCGFEPAPHHQLIIRELEAVSRGELDNLLIFMPPGSAKSTYVSVLFPSWHLANRPQDNILAATHSVEFAIVHCCKTVAGPYRSRREPSRTVRPQ